MLKKILFPLVAMFMLAGCATPPTTIEVSPKITLPQQDPSLMGVTVSINGADQRPDQALAKVTRDNQLVTLTASRDLRFLLQEVLEKQMTSRGYMIGPNGAVDLQIIVNKLYADVSQGNVRYNIATKADIAIIATAANGTKMTKNYRASYSVEGAFQASNKNIADAVNSVLTDTIADMAQDTSIHDFIKQNARYCYREPGLRRVRALCYVQSLLTHFSAAEISHFADPWLRLRSAAGPHLRYPAGLDDGGKYRSENDRFFLARRPGLCL